MLTLDVDFLLGACFGSRVPADPMPEWPLQPDRLYSALVASWAARNQCAAETEALKWLEQLEPPRIYASACSVRTPSPVFVPTNDARNSLEVLPGHRLRQERRFPAAIPDRSIAAYCWLGADPNEAIFDALQSLAHDTSYVGHSSSLVRCFFHRQSIPDQYGPGVPSARRIYAGRLAELERDFLEQRRPSRGASVPHTLSVRVPLPTSNLGRCWHVFADAGGCRPDLRATACTTRAFRKLLLSGYGGAAAPEVICGHAAEGITLKPHMAIVPMADVGWDWSDGHLMGLALILPNDTATEEAGLFRALESIVAKQQAGRSNHSECREFSIDLPGQRLWRVVRQPQAAAASLSPERYLRASKAWATVTPIVLDRHLKAKENAWRQAEMAQLIAEACTHIDLPRPSAVVPSATSAIRGSPPASRARGEPAWMSWALTDSLKSRTLTHAVVKFDKPVEGPVALGAGRFFGLGLCLPIDREQHSGANDRT